MVFNHPCGLDHTLQKANPAFIFILGFFGGVIFKILAKIALRPRFFHMFQKLFAHDDLAMFDFCFHIRNVFAG